MYESMEGDRNVAISGGSDEGESPSKLERLWHDKSKTKSIHPPIESHYVLAPRLEIKRPSSAGLGMKSMLMSYSQRVRESIRKIGKSQSMKVILEGVHEPRDERLVEAFRELLFLEGHLHGKHNDYHTLLRLVSRLLLFKWNHGRTGLVFPSQSSIWQGFRS